MMVEIGTTIRIHRARSADSEAQSLSLDPRISMGIFFWGGGGGGIFNMLRPKILVHEASSPGRI